MTKYPRIDDVIRDNLRKWPHRPMGLTGSGAFPSAWLRARPSDKGSAECFPFLKFPGSEHLRTVPDGLWLNFGGNAVEPFVDIFVIEACASLPNLLDKRSRFGASTNSLLAVCPVPWLLAPIGPDDPTPRWQMTRVIKREPRVPLILPVRDLRVMFGLKPRHYDNFVRHHVAHPHEFYVPLEALIDEQGDQEPAMQALLARAAASANFLSVPRDVSPVRRARATPRWGRVGISDQALG